MAQFPKPYISGPTWWPIACEFRDFVKTHGRFPSEYGDDPEPYLARWRRRQLGHFDSLDAEQQAFLDGIPGFRDDHSPAAQREILVGRSKDFRATHEGRSPSRHAKDPVEQRAANWERDQRTAARRGDLTEQQVTDLRDAGVLTDEQLADLRKEGHLKPDPPAPTNAP